MTNTSLERVEEAVVPLLGQLHLLAFIATPEQRALCTCQPDKTPERHKSECPTVIAALERPRLPRAEAPPKRLSRKFSPYLSLALLTALAVAAMWLFWGRA